VIALLLAKGGDRSSPRVRIIRMAAAGLGTKEEDTVGRKKTEKEVIDSMELCLKAARTSTQPTPAAKRLSSARPEGWTRWSSI